jgi:putative zinc binding protein
LKVPREGCALCEATWGDYWAEVEGQRMFFCCSVCWVQFRNMVSEVKRRTGWAMVDEIKMMGDYRGRECAALSGDKAYRFFIRFDPRGEIQDFHGIG